MCTEALIWSLTPHRFHHTQQQAPTWEAGRRQSNTNTTSSQESLTIPLHWRIQREGLPSELAFGDGSDVYILQSVTGETGLGIKTPAQTCIVCRHITLLPKNSPTVMWGCVKARGVTRHYMLPQLYFHSVSSHASARLSNSLIC